MAMPEFLLVKVLKQLCSNRFAYPRSLCWEIVLCVSGSVRIDPPIRNSNMESSQQFNSNLLLSLSELYSRYFGLLTWTFLKPSSAQQETIEIGWISRQSPRSLPGAFMPYMNKQKHQKFSQNLLNKAMASRKWYGLQGLQIGNELDKREVGSTQHTMRRRDYHVAHEMGPARCQRRCSLYQTPQRLPNNCKAERGTRLKSGISVLPKSLRNIYI